jgi:hypothetical protein
MATTFFAVTPTTSPEAMALVQTLVASGALQTVVPAPGQPPPTPTTPLATAEDVIGRIPIAKDGEVIRSNFHNSLRDAFIAMLAEVAVGRGPVAPMSPGFFPVDGQQPWALGFGTALGPIVTTGTASAQGWLPVELPHGGRMQRLVVSGGRTGQIGTFLVVLHRSPISGGPSTVEALAFLDLKDKGETFLEFADVGAPDVNDPTPAQILEHTLVDNTKYRYFITARLANAQPAARARLNSLQVVVVRV